MYYLVTEPQASLSGDEVDQVTSLPPGFLAGLERRLQYRLIFDPSAGQWRVDCRVSAGLPIDE